MTVDVYENCPIYENEYYTTLNLKDVQMCQNML